MMFGSAWGRRTAAGLTAVRPSIAFILSLACVSAISDSYAATITVNPGQSIQTAVNNAVAGDTVVINAGDYTGGITVNKAITVQGQPGAKLHATTAGTGTGVSIGTDGVTIAGLYLDSFQMAIAPSGLSARNNITIRNNHTYYSQYHLWTNGTNWLIENNNFDRVRWWDGQGDADYTRMFGTGHVFRGNYLHGTNFSNTDLAPASGSDYAHTDGIQYYGNNGEVLKNCTIENNFFTDFHQGLFLCDENTGSLSGLIIRNNVFWGQTYTPPPGSNNFNGIPSWGICIGKNVGGTSMTVQNNLMYNIANFYGIRAASTGNWSKNIVLGNGSGTVYDPSSSSPSSVTVGNIRYGYASVGQTGYLGTDTNTNPLLTNKTSPLGADGIPMTSDDGWIPTASAAAGFGPQLASTGNVVTATPDTFTGVSEDTSSVTLNVLANDSVTARAVLTIASVTTPNQGGTVQIVNSGASLAYSPRANWFGTESFSYTATDGAGASATATVSIAVADVNDPPAAVANSYTVAANSAATTFAVLANDSIAPDTGETLTITSVTAPSQGSTATNNSSNISYTPKANFSGTETFNYTISDGRGGSASATVTVTVTAPANNAPVANSDTYSNIASNSTNNVLAVTANDTDLDGDSLTVTSRTAPNHGGSASISGGSIIYAPASGYSGTETFSYTISDGKGGTASAGVTITVVSNNTAPVANGDAYTVAEDSTNTLLSVRSNDTDADNDTLTISSLTSPSQGGSASISSGSISYKPKANFNGSESFSYTISDGKGGTASANVSVTVTAVNDNPVAAADSSSVSMDSSANALAVLSNDSDIDGDTLSISDLGASSNGGTVSISGTGLSYTPAASFVGTDSFTYTVSDGKGGTATATVTVTVVDTNTAPTALADAYTLSKNSAGNSLTPCTNDTDPDPNDSFDIAGVGVPDHGGSVSLSANKSITYSPAANYIGTEKFSYTIRDTHGATATAVVTITVKDTSPTTGSDRYKVRGPKRTATTTSAIDTRAPGGNKNRLDVLANDVSNSGTPLTIVSFTQDARAPHGTVELDGSDILYAPLDGFTGTESFQYVVQDGLGQTAVGEVTVDVTEDLGATFCDTYPAILAQLAGLYYDFGLKGNDIDVDGVPDDFMLEAMQILGCYDAGSQLGSAIETAYQINLLMFDKEANAPVLADYREVIAALSAMNTSMQSVLSQTFDAAGATLGQAYVSVSCDATGACMPQPVQGQPLSDAFQLFDEVRGSLLEPLSGEGDIDSDTILNVDEYNAVVAAGGSRTEFANAVTDASLDGSTPASGGGGGGGGCFIATAAYGTPLAAQINVFRTIRDNQMLTNGFGAAFVDTYYRLSPPLARIVADYPAAALIVRAVLWPFVILGKAFVASPLLVTIALFGLPLGAGIRIRRRRQTA